MNAPQGLFDFPGIELILRGTFTLSHGISPSVATIEVVPQAGLPAAGGTLLITFGGTVLAFPGCRINSLSQRRSSAGTVWTLQIFDRRWRWAFGELSGLYNVRLADGRIDPALERTPQQLAALCLSAMGEANFSVAELPNDARPEVDWIAANPAQELAHLCEAFGCRVVLGLDNRVSLRRVGVGAGLPVEDGMTENLGIDPPERPDALKLITGPTRFQSAFVLEAVGQDTQARQNAIKLIQDLSYNPGGAGNPSGWEHVYPHSMPGVVASEEARKLALKTVYKWYRIKEQLGRPGRLDPPGFPGSVVRLDQLLPISDELVQTRPGPNGTQASRDAVVRGSFYETFRNPPSFQNTAGDEVYNGSYTIDGERGIVVFDQPVYRYFSSGAYLPAVLLLECSYGVKHRESRQVFRHGFERRLPGNVYGTGPQILRREEIVRTVRAEYDRLDPMRARVTRVVDNLPEISLQADHYLNAAQSEYQLSHSADMEYAGIIPINPDGAIQQVSWSVGPHGATTRASRNSEFALYVPGYEERRRREAAWHAAREQDRAERAAARRMRRREPHA